MIYSFFNGFVIIKITVVSRYTCKIINVEREWIELKLCFLRQLFMDRIRIMLCDIRIVLYDIKLVLCNVLIGLCRVTALYLLKTSTGKTRFGTEEYINE